MNMNRSPLSSGRACMIVLLGMLALSIVFGSFGAACAAQAGAAGEYQVKAGFIFNFLRFVEWPAESFAPNGKTVSVCVLGANVFDASLDAYRGEVVAGRRVAVVYPKTLAEAENCNVLFLSPSERRRAYQVMKYLEGKSVLTISDIDGFVEQGGMIGFYMDKGYVRFDINLSLAKKARLNIGSQLLRHARVKENQP